MSIERDRPGGGVAAFMLSACAGALAQTFRVTIAPSLQQMALDGRLLLLLSNNDREEPRFQISDAAGTQMVFGVDVDGCARPTTGAAVWLAAD